ncbi:MAG TPA: phage tail tube protein [Chloroflexota bacterium]|nr:phage tail tube protein [Chloroflexota bacterium]HZS89888.1 phage tail tube protein [Chloroflexota bacterium]
MAGGPPVLQIGAEQSLGYVLQPTFGTPVAVPATANNWVPFTANTLLYDIGEHLIQTGSGSRGAEQYAAQGQSKSSGDFETLLFGEQCANLYAYFFGGDAISLGWTGTTTAVAAGATSGTLTPTGGSTLTAVITATSWITVELGTAREETVQLATLNTGTGAYTLNAQTPFQFAHAASSPVMIGYLHSITPTQPRLLTLEDQQAGQSYQLQDVLLDQLDLTSSKTDWKAKFTVMGGHGANPIASGTPTFSATDVSPLEWGHLSAITLPGGVSINAVDAFSLTIKNGVKQFWGGGTFDPTRARGGLFTVAGKYTILFDSAAAATSYANYVAGVETQIAATIGANPNKQHVITLPNSRMTKHPKKLTLPEFVAVDVDFGVRKPMGITWAITNADSVVY